MNKTIFLISSALRYLPLTLRLADRFAARHCRSKYPARLLALRGLLRAVRAQRAHPELPLFGLFIHGYVLGELNASRRSRRCPSPLATHEVSSPANPPSL